MEHNDDPDLDQPELNATVAVDLVVLTLLEDQLAVLLVRRQAPPFENRLTLPGGVVLDDEDLAEAAERQFWEETGLEPVRVHMEQLAAYGGPARGREGRVVTVAYLVVVPGMAAGLGAGSGDGSDPPEWVPVDEVLDNPRRLAAGHHRVLADGVERARAKLEYSSLATAFCLEEFTIGDLRRVYEAVWGTSLDPRNFHRKMSGTADFAVETGRITSGEGGRPARLYRRGNVTVLHPPMLRP